jgi:hypothetical protein
MPKLAGAEQHNNFSHQEHIELKQIRQILRVNTVLL